MSIRNIRCTIKGMSPLLMHRYPLEPVEAIEKKSIEERAEIGAYRIPSTGNLYLPGVAFQRALVGGAAFSKGKGRASLQKVVAACVIVSPEYGDLGVSEYLIDTRPVVIPATKGRVLCSRPRLDEWQATFAVEYDDTLLTEDQLRRVVDDTGSRVGVLDFRPEKKGPFGRFVVIHWES